MVVKDIHTYLPWWRGRSFSGRTTINLTSCLPANPVAPSSRPVLDWQLLMKSPVPNGTKS